MHKGNEKIAVCFIAPKAYCLFNPDAKNVKDPFGGSEVDLYLLALELAKDKDFRISFITADYGQEEVETIKGIRIIKTVDFEQNLLIGAIKVWLGLRRADAQIYFHEVASWGTFLIALFCKLHKKIFIYRTGHQRECNGTYLKQHYFAGKAFSWSLAGAAEVVVQNESDKREIKQTIGVDSIVIPNAHYLPQLSENQRDIILWVGRSARIKRPELFVKLAQMYPDEKFVMICPRALGDDGYDELVSKAGWVKNLEFISQVPFSEIETFFQRAKLFICTSEGEGFPNTYVEACKCGTAILSLCVNPDSFLSSCQGGLCADDDWDKFVKQFEMLLNTEKLREYGKNARKYAEQKHDITKVAPIYKQIFMRLGTQL